MLSTLASHNPKLRKLDLTLNSQPKGLVRNQPLPAITGPLLSNIFPHLVEFRLTGLLEAPDPATLSAFLVSHPNLRSLTCSLPVKNLDLPENAFPLLEDFEGDLLLLVAICKSSPLPRDKITRVKISRVLYRRAVLAQIVPVFPLLPKLADLFVQFSHSENVTPEFFTVLGHSCPDLKLMSLRDPGWVGEQVS